MRCAREDHVRGIMFDSTTLPFDGREALRRHIVRFVGGIRGKRENPVSKKQIIQFFRATAPAFTESVLGEVAMEGDKIRLVRNSLARRGNWRDSYRYEVVS